MPSDTIPPFPDDFRRFPTSFITLSDPSLICRTPIIIPNSFYLSHHVSGPAAVHPRSSWICDHHLITAPYSAFRYFALSSDIHYSGIASLMYLRSCPTAVVPQLENRQSNSLVILIDLPLYTRSLSPEFRRTLSSHSFSVSHSERPISSNPNLTSFVLSCHFASSRIALDKYCLCKRALC